MVAADKVVQILALERPGLQSKVLVRPKIVNPQLRSPWILTGRLAVKEQDVRLDALRIKYPRRQTQQRMRIAFMQQPLANPLARAALKQDVVGDNHRRPAR